MEKRVEGKQLIYHDCNYSSNDDNHDINDNDNKNENKITTTATK